MELINGFLRIFILIAKILFTYGLEIHSVLGFSMIFKVIFSSYIAIKYALVLHPQKNKSKRRNGKFESNAQ